MVGKAFAIGELVWAKMKGFPYWPARVESPSLSQKSSSIKKSQHFVFFFGSDNYAWILDDCIVRHSKKMLKNVSKIKSSSFQNAIEEITKLSKKSPMPVKLEIKEEIFSEISSPIVNNTEQKVGKILKSLKVISPKKEKDENVQNNIVRKRSLSEETADNHEFSPSAKALKVEDDYLALINNLPPNIGSSRVAVVRPYEDESTVHQASDMLKSGEYIERSTTPELEINVDTTLLHENITPTQKKIGFLGLGMMGQGIVKNLLNLGHDVTIWNRSLERCLPFTAATAKAAQTPADVVANCDIIFCCVSDPDAVKAIFFGSCGVLKGFDGVSVGTKGYVEMTSIDPITSVEIAAAISLVGGRYLEAPIIGSTQLANEGSLLILGAGDRELFDECESCFSAISKHAYYLGSTIGSGCKLNLIYSMFLGTTYAAIAEVMCLVERCKLKLEDFLEILDLGPLSCTALLEKGRAMIDHNFSTDTALKHQQKDLNLALSISNTYAQPMLVSAAANEMYKHARSLCCAEHDVSAVLYGAKY